MVLKVISLKSRSRNTLYDAVLFVNDKTLLDEVDRAFDMMLSDGVESTRRNLGSIKLLIKPRNKKINYEE